MERKKAHREARRQSGPRNRANHPKARPVQLHRPAEPDHEGGRGEDHFEQAYNAQAAVEVDSRLIVGQRVTDAPNDKQELVPTVQVIQCPVVGEVKNVLADSGFYSEAAAKEVEANGGPTVMAAVERKSHHCTVAD